MRVLLAAGLALAASGCLKRSGDQAALDASSPASTTAGTTASVQPASVQPASVQPGTAARSGTTAAAAAERRHLVLPPHLRDLASNPQPTAQTASVTGSLAPGQAAAVPAAATAGSATPRRAVAPARGFKLAEAVASAVMSYPEIRAFEARAREAKAGVSMAEAGFWPSGDIRLATGGNFSGAYEGRTIPYRTSSNNVDGRFDSGVVLRQLVYDFGATSSDVRRAELLRDSERLKLRDKIEDVAGKTAQAYLKVLEQRALLGLIDDVIGAHENLARIIQAHAREGHGTVADVERVNARIVDVRSIRSDVTLQLKAAEDQFERMTRHRPGVLAAPPDLTARTPRGPDAAIAEMLANNPRLAAIASNTRASQAELDFQRASALPRFNLEVEGESKNFRNGPAGRTQAEARGMLAMRYRFMDGGLNNATQEQILARIDAGEYSMLNEREQIEQDIRQAYRAIGSSRSKLKLIGSGVASASRVRELYLEQFKGGKRTVFELLDSQMSLYTIRRNQIESQFEGRRAAFEILRATGKLTQILANGS